MAPYFSRWFYTKMILSEYVLSETFFSGHIPTCMTSRRARDALFKNLTEAETSSTVEARRSFQEQLGGRRAAAMV
jgi:hypothetical protein